MGHAFLSGLSIPVLSTVRSAAAVARRGVAAAVSSRPPARPPPWLGSWPGFCGALPPLHLRALASLDAGGSGGIGEGGRVQCPLSVPLLPCPHSYEKRLY